MYNRVLHVFGQMEKAGAESRTMDLFREISRLGYIFDFVVTKPGEHYYFEEIRNLGGKIYYIQKKKSVFGFVRYFLKLIKTIRSNKYKTIHTHTSMNEGVVLFAGFLGGAKVRVAHSRTANDMKKGIGFKFYSFIMRVFINLFSTKRLYCSNEAGKFLFGRKIKKSIFFPNAIDLSSFNVEDSKIGLKRKFGFSKDYIVGTVGNLRPEKNQDLLIELAKMFKMNSVENIEIIIVGNGILYEQYMSIIERDELGEYISLLGQRSDIPEIMKCMDVFLLPSLYEGLPGVIIEAIASGLPSILSSNITRDLQNINSGLLNYSDIDDVTKWYEQLYVSLKIERYDNEVYHSMLAKSGYSVKGSVSKLLEVYTSK